jgi:hypothetical protein
LRLYNNVEVFDGTTTQTYKNVMGILREIGITEQVVALSMVPAETPAEQSFRVNVNRAGFSNVYRTNQFTRTYLTETTVSTGRFDDVLHVHDVRKLVQVLEFTETPDGDNFVRVPVNNADQITAIIIVDGLGTVITDYTIDQPVTGGNTNYLNNNNSLGITINEPYYGPVAITVAVGNRVYIQGEYVGFTSVNLVDNTITGLKRGLSGTITNSVFEQYSTVQGMLERDRFPQEWYSVNWYDRYAPLQLNTTEQAWFLRQQLP